MNSSKSTTESVKHSSTDECTTGANESAAVVKKNRQSDSESSDSESESSSGGESFATVKARLMDGSWCYDCERWVDGPFECPSCLEAQGLHGYDTNEEDDDSDDEKVGLKRRFKVEEKPGYNCHYCERRIDPDNICDCVVYRVMNKEKEQRKISRQWYKEECRKPPKRGTKVVAWRNPKVKVRLASIDRSQLNKSDDESE